MTLPLVQATPLDVPAIRSLRDEASEWLASMGSDQWSRPSHYDPDSVHGLDASISRGEVYVLRDGGDVIATLTLDTHADPEFWTAEDQPDDALYVHRMIVRGSARGTNIGGRMLDWALDAAAKRGKRWLRLDAWRSNTALQNYYQRQGFTHVRTVDLPHRGSGALFQQLTSSDGPTQEGQAI